MPTLSVLEHQSGYQLPRAAVSGSGQRVCCAGATDNHFPRPHGYSAWTSGPHYKLGGLLVMKTPQSSCSPAMPQNVNWVLELSFPALR